jgi:hypothetical protein
MSDDFKDEILLYVKGIWSRIKLVLQLRLWEDWSHIGEVLRSQQFFEAAGPLQKSDVFTEGQE